MPKNTQDTGVKCVIPNCGGFIVAEIEQIKTVPLDQIPFGSSGMNCFEVVIHFHCSNPHCQVAYHCPPGKETHDKDWWTKEIMKRRRTQNLD